jgi:hypothetical protein
MQQDRFDEFQIAKRHRIGFQTLFLTITLIVLNGIVKMNYIWAEPLMEMLVLLHIPITYFTVMLIWKGAYTSKKENEKSSNFYILMFGLVALFSLFVLGQSIWYGTFVLIVDGKLAMSAGILFQTTYVMLITITQLVRRAVDFRAMRTD